MMGLTLVSTGQRVRIVALGNVEAVRVGVSRPKTTKNVNANTSTKGEVAISGMGVKFSTRTAKAALAV